MTIKHCTECEFHKVLRDPDPYDWFCNDDVKVSCKKKKNKIITLACRPYNTKKETKVPEWCPLEKN